MAETTNHQPHFQDTQAEEDTIDIKQIVAKVISNWMLFAASVVICTLLAVVYWYFSQPEWHTSSKILVEDQKNSLPGSSGGGGMNAEFSSLFNVKSSADNEIQILKSRSLMTEVVRQMQLNVRTYRQAGLKKVEIYDEAPFTVALRYKADTLKPRVYTVKVQDATHFELTNSKDDINLKGKFGDSIKLSQYNMVLNSIAPTHAGEVYAISIESPDAAIDGFAKDFSAALSDKQATTIDLTISYPNPKKGEAILKKLMQVYLERNLENKVAIADSTMHFIDGRLAIVQHDLSDVEKQFEQYKEQHNIADISEQSKALVSSASDYYKKLKDQQLQLSVVNDLEKYINSPGNKKVVPSSLIVPTDMSFGQAINSYNDLIIARERASLSYTESNPVIKNYDQQIETARQALLRNVATYKKSLEVGISQLQQQNSTFTGQLKSIPSKERGYLDFARQQNLKQELYLYLLQKREETAISKTSTISSSRIIDYAKSDFLPYKPKRGIIVLIGLILGIIIPGVYLFVKELLNIRITSKADIEKATTVAVIGEISHNTEEKSLVTGTGSRSVISEQFRALRTNLQYVLDQRKSNVLLFTSSMSGEGKSFLSLNLGSVLALTGKKVVFMEMDLRKPKLSENMGLDHSNGFTNYIISGNTDYRSLVKPAWFNENCYLISAGPIPPNPAELLMSDKLGELIDDLKKEFDYVIIDCAPVGLVTDALMLEKYADLTLYVVRQDYTYKSQLNIVNDLQYNNKVKKMYLIVNDIKTQKSGYAAYGTGSYGGYGYGGYAEETKKNWLQKLVDK